MSNELLEGIRRSGKSEIAVVGPKGCGKTTFARAFAGSLSGGAVFAEGESVRAELAEGGVSVAEYASAAELPQTCGCAVLVTSDGSFGRPRGEVIAEEESAVKSLRDCGIAFIIVVNGAAGELCGALEEKYGCAAISVNCAAESDYSAVEEGLLFSLPVTSLEIDLPDWMCVLPAESKIISEILEKVRAVSPKICCARDCPLMEDAFAEGDVYCEASEVNPASGCAHYSFAAKEGMFYSVLSEECGADISDDLRLMAYVRSMKEAKKFYDKFRGALASAEENGYGVVYPKEEDMVLQPPELVRRGTRTSVKLKADASSYHLIKIDVHSEVCPVSGESARSEEIARGIVDSYEKDAEALWNTDMFGKTFKEMVRGGLDEKLGNMPEDARGKLRKAVTRIVNEGKGGVICILL